MPKDCIIMEIERSKRRVFIQLINHIHQPWSVNLGRGQKAAMQCEVGVCGSTAGLPLGRSRRRRVGFCLGEQGAGAKAAGRRWGADAIGN